MSWIRIWVHIVFTTKMRKPLIPKEIRPLLFQHIKDNAYKKGIFLKEVNGFHNHVHILLSLNKEISLSKSVQLIKGESSYWINKEKLLKHKFSWQDDYWAVSVSEAHINQVSTYIKNQEDHHKTKSFSEEIEQFMKKYGWDHVKKNSP